MEPVAIDLRELTARRLRTALGTMGKACEYQTPCIIGTLIERGRRRALDEADVDATDIKTLALRGYISLPEEQIEAAIALQNAYDHKKPERLRELARPWIAASKGEQP